MATPLYSNRGSPNCFIPRYKPVTSVDAQNLSQYMAQMQVAHKYGEAHDAQQQLRQLKEDGEMEQLRMLRERHADELLNLEEEHAREYAAFDAKWDNIMLNVRRKSQGMEALLRKRQEQELYDIQQRRVTTEFRPKFSAEYLSMRRSEQALVYAKEFDKAELLKQKADFMEEHELGYAQAQYHQKWDADEANLKAQHERELEALRRKIATMHDEKIREQERELDRFMKKYQASKAATQRQHALEKYQLNNALKGVYPTRRLGSAPSKSMNIPTGAASAAFGKLPVNLEMRPGTAPPELYSSGQPLSPHRKAPSAIPAYLGKSSRPHTPPTQKQVNKSSSLSSDVWGTEGPKKNATNEAAEPSSTLYPSTFPTSLSRFKAPYGGCLSTSSIGSSNSSFNTTAAYIGNLRPKNMRRIIGAH